MLPSVPDSVTPVVERAPKVRPRLLKFVIAYTVVQPWINWLVYEKDSEDADILEFLALQGIVWLLAYALWAGKNWARFALVAIYSLSLLTLFSLEAFTPKARVDAALGAVLSLAMAWWLCSPSVVEFCKGKKS